METAVKAPPTELVPAVEANSLAFDMLRHYIPQCDMLIRVKHERQEGVVLELDALAQRRASVAGHSATSRT